MGPKLVIDDSNVGYNQEGSPPVVRAKDVVPGEIGGGVPRRRLVIDDSLTTEEQASAPELRIQGSLDPLGRYKEILPDASPFVQTGLAALQTQTFNQQEFADILQKVDPRIEIQKGGDGALYVRHPNVGQTVVINKPGISLNDAVQIASAALATTPAGMGKTVASRALREAIIQASIEVTQAASGGQFNPEEVAMSSGFSVISDVPGMFSRGMQSRRAAEQAENRGVSDAVPEIREVARQGRAGSVPVENRAEALAETVQPDLAKSRAVDDLGLGEIAPARIVSSNPQYVAVEQALSQIPGSQLAQREQEFIQGLSAKTGEFIEEFGGTRNVTGFDISVKAQMDENINLSRIESGKLYDKLAEGVNPRTRLKTELTPLSSTLINRARDLGGVKFLSPLEQKILREVRGAQKGRGMTYARLDELRKEVGEKLGKSSMFEVGSAEFQLSRLYDNLTEAQDVALEAIDPKLRNVWDTAKKMVSQRKELEKIVTKVAGKDLEREVIPQLSTAIKNLGSGRSQRFVQIMEAIPEELRQEAVITAMGAVFTSGARTATELVPGAFASWWTKLKRDSGARKLLFKNLPKGAPRFLNNLAIVSQSFADAAKSAPKTGIINAMESMNNDGGFISKVLGVLPGFGTVGTALLKTTEEDALKTAGDLLAQPAFKRIMSRRARGLPTDKAEEAFKKQKSYIKWLNSVPNNMARRIATVGFTDWLFETDSQAPENEGTE
jgi:hypothetical protein